MTIYNIIVEKQDGTTQTLEQYKGHVMLIVNTATHCGFTPQYTALQALYEHHQGKGLVILDFPCNQFKEQAPENDAEINAFCSLHYHTTFPRFKKIDVNGEHTSPLFAYLKQTKSGLFNEDIKWNFTKFLVNRQGEIVKRYAPQTDPKTIEKDILDLLSCE